MEHAHLWAGRMDVAPAVLALLTIWVSAATLQECHKELCNWQHLTELCMQRCLLLLEEAGLHHAQAWQGADA